MNHEMESAIAHLRARDPVLAALMERLSPYEWRATRNLFEVMLRTIVSQQLSTKAADSIYARLASAMGPGRPLPGRILALPDEELRACGLSRSKTIYVKNVARHFESGRHTPRSFAGLDDSAVIESLTSIKGVGEWSAHMFLIFGLRRPDVFPIGDLGLRKAMLRAYGLRANTGPPRLHRIAEGWRPYRSVGTLYLWRSYDAE